MFWSIKNNLVPAHSIIVFNNDLQIYSIISYLIYNLYKS